MRLEGNIKDVFSKVFNTVSERQVFYVLEALQNHRPCRRCTAFQSYTRRSRKKGSFIIRHLPHLTSSAIHPSQQGVPAAAQEHGRAKSPGHETQKDQVQTGSGDLTDHH